MADVHLSDLVRRQSALLDDLFFGAPHELVDVSPEACMLRTAWVEMDLAYDWRDQFVDARLKPLNAPDEISDSYPDISWLRFLGIEAEPHRKSALDDQQVIDELNLVRPILELFKDGARTRDALWFLNGYSQAYTDWAAGK